MSRVRVLLRLVVAIALSAALPATDAGAQIASPREIVSKQIDVGRSVAGLRLEFADGGALELELNAGEVVLDGDDVGSYPPGAALDAAWRALLGEAVTLDEGSLARRLRDWAPAAGLPAGEAALAGLMDDALEAALFDAATAPAARASTGVAPDRGLATLLERPERLLALARAVEDFDLDDVRAHVGEDVTVAGSETVDGDVVVVDGDLEVEGEVDGSVVIVDGALRFLGNGRVTGDALLVDAVLFGSEGRVLGDVTDADEFDDGTDLGRLRDEIRDQIRSEMNRGGRERGGGFGDALGGLLGTLVTILLVAVLGGGLALHFAREELDVITETARSNPVQAGMVGVAGAFLVIPAWVLGCIGLVITIVGILALPFWIVLFPVAVGLAAGLGYIAVAQGLGEWIARQRFARLEWVRSANPYTTMIAGVGTLMLLFALSHLFGMVDFLRFASVLFAGLGGLVTATAVLVGFGAILMTRGGRRPTYPHAGVGTWGDNWDDDLGFGPTTPPDTAGGVTGEGGPGDRDPGEGSP